MKSLLTKLFLVAFVFIAGCYKPYDPRINLKEEVRSDTLASNIITRPIGTAFSALIGEGIEITSMQTVQNKGGFMEVHIAGYNKATGVRKFEYKMDWLDGRGLVIDSSTSVWLPVSAAGKSAFNFYAVAPSRDAVDFKINTRK